MQKSSGMLQPSVQSGRSKTVGRLCDAAAEFGVRRKAKPCAKPVGSDSCKVDCQKTDSEAENKVGPEHLLLVLQNGSNSTIFGSGSGFWQSIVNWWNPRSFIVCVEARGLARSRSKKWRFSCSFCFDA